MSRPEARATAPNPAATKKPRARKAAAATKRSAKSAGKAATPRTSLGPQDWVDAALDLLVDQGIDAVRVDVLAKRIGVSRGSFYWHFRERGDLLAAVLRHWQQLTTERHIERWTAGPDGQPLDSRMQVRELIGLPHRGRAAARAARIELAMRAWARRDPVARRALDQLDQRRLSYGDERFRALGFDDAQARARSFLLYAYQLAESLVRPGPRDREERQARAERVERLLLDGLPPG